MDSTFSRISENVLFSILIAAVVGWSAVAVAGVAAPSAAPVACSVAKVAAGIRNS